MSTLVDKLLEKKLISPPKWLPPKVCYLTIMGSDAYGCSAGSSDLDIYGFCVPPKEHVFPWTNGEIPGFGQQIQRFDQWQEHHVKDVDAGKEYDLQVFSIVKYFQLAMENNPNMVDSLFTPRRCVIATSPIGDHVRNNRLLFLHKGSFHKFRGYAFAQMNKIKNKVNASNPKRAATIDAYGYDVKFAYHVARLALECEQILNTHDLDLERDREVYKSIRRGEWTIERLEEWFTDKERQLEAAYASSSLRHKPDEAAIKAVLLECLEMHFGSLSNLLKVETRDTGSLVADIQRVLEKYQ